MKLNSTNCFVSARWVISLAAIGTLLAGCSSAKQKEKPALARGWVGGEFKLVRSFPKPLTPRPKAGILVTAIGTNTPAAAAGLRAGDLILQLDHQPFARLQDFRAKIDSSAPGSLLPVTAYRDGQKIEYDVPVGRETFHNGGMFSIGFPGIILGWELWPRRDSPGISLGVLGYNIDPGHREELASVKKAYDLKCNPEWKGYDEDYKIWLVFFELAKGKNIVAQEMVEAKK